ncbi:hypothetical protein [Novosphingobium decolorationis]|uniref:PRC-barrel domain-containing protein n=1 Tax=Novosphingobium decolorationis TaxID=2698673 RepID=A0ABX8E7W2_9SPHN|nr:hypothetical protein [Novosphingobium decolorationis]QVM85109.1 hypothetical protein HT578_16655 [Novosphingobium decolorationis]
MLHISVSRSARMAFLAAPVLLAGAASGARPVAAQSGVIARTDAEIAKAMQSPYLKMVRNISPSELVPGTPVVEGDGGVIGTVEGRDGATVVLVDDRYRYRVPVTEIYAYTSGDGDHFASRVARKDMARAKLEAGERRGG